MKKLLNWPLSSVSFKNGVDTCPNFLDERFEWVCLQDTQIRVSYGVRRELFGMCCFGEGSAMKLESDVRVKRLPSVVLLSRFWMISKRMSTDCQYFEGGPRSDE